MSFPDCAPGLECVDSGLVSIGGGGSNVCKIPTPPTPYPDVLAEEGDICEGFNESTGRPYPSCAPGLLCEDSGLASIGGSAGKRCVKPEPEPELPAQ